MQWGKGLNRKTKELLKLFCIVSGITAAICVAILGLGIVTFNKMIYQEDTTVGVDKGAQGDNGGVGLGTSDLNGDNKDKVNSLNKTVAVFGTDVTGVLTDVIFVANFNSETNEAKVVAVPRDTRVVWNEVQKLQLLPGHEWVRESKLNEMSSHTGMDKLRGGTINYLETLLGVGIDNYVIVSTSAFREIVDAIDGIEINVPQRMKKDDYSQNLHIDLYPGVQVLNGEQAEGFVRYRDYRMGDLDRIKVQQVFMQVFAEKVLSPSIITKIPAIIDVVINSVKTDVKLSEIPNYMPYLTSFDINNLSFYTAPGTFGDIQGLSYYIVDEEKTKELISTLFK